MLLLFLVLGLFYHPQYFILSTEASSERGASVLLFYTTTNDSNARKAFKFFSSVERIKGNAAKKVFPILFGFSLLLLGGTYILYDS